MAANEQYALERYALAYTLLQGTPGGYHYL